MEELVGNIEKLKKKWKLGRNITKKKQKQKKRSRTKIINYIQKRQKLRKNQPTNRDPNKCHGRQSGRAPFRPGSPRSEKSYCKISTEKMMYIGKYI